MTRIAGRNMHEGTDRIGVNESSRESQSTADMNTHPHISYYHKVDAPTDAVQQDAFLLVIERYLPTIHAVIHSVHSSVLQIVYSQMPKKQIC